MPYSNFFATQMWLAAHQHHTDFWFWMAFGWTVFFAVCVVLFYTGRHGIRWWNFTFWCTIVGGACIPVVFQLWSWYFFA